MTIANRVEPKRKLTSEELAEVKRQALVKARAARAANRAARSEENTEKKTVEVLVYGEPQSGESKWAGGKQDILCVKTDSDTDEQDEDEIDPAEPTDGSDYVSCNGLHVPPRYVRLYKKAMAGNKTAAIKANCLMCQGWEDGVVAAVRDCQAVGCPLYAVRPFQRKSSGD